MVLVQVKKLLLPLDLGSFYHYLLININNSSFWASLSVTISLQYRTIGRQFVGQKSALYDLADHFFFVTYAEGVERRGRRRTIYSQKSGQIQQKMYFSLYEKKTSSYYCKCLGARLISLSSIKFLKQQEVTFPCSYRAHLVVPIQVTLSRKLSVSRQRAREAARMKSRRPHTREENL